MTETADEPIVQDLGNALLDTIDEFSRRCDGQLTTGNVMGALFGLFVTTAQESPQYNRDRFLAEINDRLRDLA